MHISYDSLLGLPICIWNMLNIFKLIVIFEELLCTMMSEVVLFAHRMLNILRRELKNSTKEV